MTQGREAYSLSTLKAQKALTLKAELVMKYRTIHAASPKAQAFFRNWFMTGIN